MSYRKHLMTMDEPPSELYKAAEVSTNLAEVGTDCISRQAALVAVKDALMAWSYMPEWRDEKILEAIAELPTIHPERKECEEREQGKCLWYAG